MTVDIYVRCTLRFPSTELRIVFQILIYSLHDVAVAQSAIEPALSNDINGSYEKHISPCSSPSGTVRSEKLVVNTSYVGLSSN